MDLRKVIGWAKGHRNSLVVVAFVFILAAADLLVNRPKGDVQWLSVPLLVAGLVLLALIVWPTAKPGPRPSGDTLAHRLLWRFTLRGRLVPFFPIGGVVLLIADLAYNVYLSPTPQILTHDQSVLFLGAVLVAYRFVPIRYDRERDFVLLFAVVLSSILVVPLVLLRIASGDPVASVDAYSTYALAPQTSFLLRVFGVPNQLIVGPDAAPILAFTTSGNLRVSVAITSACSGIYSFAIFASAFAAYVLTEQRSLTKRVAVFFALGILLAYVANILRMVVIVMISYRFDQTGIENLLVAHSNAGWLIFLLWIGLFWLLLFRFLPRDDPAAKGVEDEPKPWRRRGTFCGICSVILTPAIPATQCGCGRLYHLECLATEGSCPNCATPSPSLAAQKQAA